MVQVCKTLNAPISKPRKKAPQVQAVPGENSSADFSKYYHPFATARGKIVGLVIWIHPTRPDPVRDPMVNRSNAASDSSDMGRTVPGATGIMASRPVAMGPPAGRTPSGRRSRARSSERPHVQDAVAGEDHERPADDLGRPDDLGPQLDRPALLPIAAERHDAAGAIHGQPAVGESHGPAGDRGIERPGADRAQVSPASDRTRPSAVATSTAAPGGRRVGDDPAVEGLLGLGRPGAGRAWSSARAGGPGPRRRPG